MASSLAAAAGHGAAAVTVAPLPAVIAGRRNAAHGLGAAGHGAGGSLAADAHRPAYTRFAALANCEQHYLSLRSRRGMWFAALKRDLANGLLPYIGAGSVDCPFAQPRVRGSVRESGDVQLAGDRPASVLAEAVAEARRRIASSVGLNSRGGVTVWLPFSLDNGGESHALAMLLRVPRSGPVEVVVFEPHGSDPTHTQHSGGSWFRFYARDSFEQTLLALVEAGIPGAHVYLPSSYEPSVFGQSTSDVLGRGVGDRWCVLWTLAFLVFCTKNGTPPQFVALVEAKRKAGTLGRWVEFLLIATDSWMVSPLVPLPVDDPPLGAQQQQPPSRQHAQLAAAAAGSSSSAAAASHQGGAPAGSSSSSSSASSARIAALLKSAAALPPPLTSSSVLALPHAGTASGGAGGQTTLAFAVQKRKRPDAPAAAAAAAAVSKPQYRPGSSSSAASSASVSAQARAPPLHPASKGGNVVPTVPAMGKWSDEETAALHSLLASFGGFEDATAEGNTSCARRIVASGRIPSRSVEQLKDKLKDMRRASLAGSRKEADSGGVAAGGRSKKAAAAPARAAAPAAAATTVARARKGVAPAKPQVSARVRRAAAAPLLALPAPPASTASSSASSTSASDSSSTSLSDSSSNDEGAADEEDVEEGEEGGGEGSEAVGDKPQPAAEKAAPAVGESMQAELRVGVRALPPAVEVAPVSLAGGAGKGRGQPPVAAPSLAFAAPASTGSERSGHSSPAPEPADLGQGAAAAASSGSSSSSSSSSSSAARPPPSSIYATGKWSDEETAALHSLLASFGGFEDATAEGNTSCARRIVASGRIPSRSVEQLKDKLKDMRRAGKKAGLPPVPPPDAPPPHDALARGVGRSAAAQLSMAAAAASVLGMATDDDDDDDGAAGGEEGDDGAFEEEAGGGDGDDAEPEEGEEGEAEAGDGEEDEEGDADVEEEDDEVEPQQRVFLDDMDGAGDGAGAGDSGQGPSLHPRTRPRADDDCDNGDLDDDDAGARPDDAAALNGSLHAPGALEAPRPLHHALYATPLRAAGGGGSGARLPLNEPLGVAAVVAASCSPVCEWPEWEAQATAALQSRAAAAPAAAMRRGAVAMVAAAAASSSSAAAPASSSPSLHEEAVEEEAGGAGAHPCKRSRSCSELGPWEAEGGGVALGGVASSAAASGGGIGGGGTAGGGISATAAGAAAWAVSGSGGRRGWPLHGADEEDDEVGGLLGGPPPLSVGGLASRVSSSTSASSASFVATTPSGGWAPRWGAGPLMERMPAVGSGSSSSALAAAVAQARQQQQLPAMASSVGPFQLLQRLLGSAGSG